MNNRNGYMGGSYLGAGYSPFYQPSYMAYQQQPTQQPQMQMQTQQTQPIQNQCVPFSDVRYGTIDEAKAYIVMPNASVMFIDKNLGEFYIKSANQMGEPSLEEFVFKKKGLDKKEEVKEEPKQEVDFKEFVKFDDIKGLLSEKDAKNFITREELKNLNSRFDKMEHLVKLLTKGDSKNDK